MLVVWIKRTLAALALFALVAFFVALFETPTPSTILTEEEMPYLIQGLSYGDWRHNRLFLQATADQLKITARTYLAFKVHSIRQVVLSGLSLQLYLDKKDKNLKKFSFSEALGGVMPQSNGVGHSKQNKISRILFKPFSLTVFHTSIPSLSVKAKRGVMNGSGVDGIRFSDVTIEHLNTHKSIQAATAFWNDDHNTFLIPGRYYFKTSRGHGYGDGVQVGLDFSLKPL